MRARDERASPVPPAGSGNSIDSMPGKQRSRSGQGGLVIESRQKAGSRCDGQNSGEGAVACVGSAAAWASGPDRLRRRPGEMGDCIDRHDTLRVASFTIDRAAFGLNLSFGRSNRRTRA